MGWQDKEGDIYFIIVWLIFKDSSSIVSLISSENIKRFILCNYNLYTKKVIPFRNGVQNNDFMILADKDRFVFRVYNRKTINELKYTIQILHVLQKNSFPSPEIIHTLNNKWSIEFEGKPCILYRYIQGDNIKEVSTDLIRQIGRLQGWMHTLLTNERQNDEALTWDYDDLLIIIDKNRYHIESKFSDLIGGFRFIEDELLKIPFADSLLKGGTHQDIKPENVLVRNKNIVAGFVDFDNGYYGVLLNDITTVICWYCFIDNRLDLRLFEGFVKSYNKERALTDAEKDFFYQGLKYRLLREAVIWPIYVSFKIDIARKRFNYFLGLYNNLNIYKRDILNIVNFRG